MSGRCDAHREAIARLAAEVCRLDDENARLRDAARADAAELAELRRALADTLGRPTEPVPELERPKAGGL